MHHDVLGGAVHRLLPRSGLITEFRMPQVKIAHPGGSPLARFVSGLLSMEWRFETYTKGMEGNVPITAWVGSAPIQFFKTVEYTERKSVVCTRFPKSSWERLGVCP